MPEEYYKTQTENRTKIESSLEAFINNDFHENAQKAEVKLPPKRNIISAITKKTDTVTRPSTA